MQHHVILFALKVSLSFYCVTSISGVNYFSGLWGMGISDSNFKIYQA